MISDSSISSHDDPEEMYLIGVELLNGAVSSIRTRALQKTDKQRCLAKVAVDPGVVNNWLALTAELSRDKQYPYENCKLENVALRFREVETIGRRASTRYQACSVRPTAPQSTASITCH